MSTDLIYDTGSRTVWSLLDVRVMVDDQIHALLDKKSKSYENLDISDIIERAKSVEKDYPERAEQIYLGIA